MNFEDLLRRAKEGDAEAIKEIHLMYLSILTMVWQEQVEM